MQIETYGTYIPVLIVCKLLFQKKKYFMNKKKTANESNQRQENFQIATMWVMGSLVYKCSLDKNEIHTMNPDKFVTNSPFATSIRILKTTE